MNKINKLKHKVWQQAKRNRKIRRSQIVTFNETDKLSDVNYRPTKSQLPAIQV